MAQDKAEKAKRIAEFQRGKSDTGSPEVQIGLLTLRITELTEHLQFHKHDEASRMGLLKWVGRRRRLLKYLKRENFKGYMDITEKLKIRRK